jgi:hypothetical protein
LRTAAVILGGVIGAVLGFYAGAYGRVAYMHLMNPGYTSDYDFAIVGVAVVGAVLGGAVGILLGRWLASRSAVP